MEGALFPLRAFPSLVLRCSCDHPPPPLRSPASVNMAMSCHQDQDKGMFMVYGLTGHAGRTKKNVRGIYTTSVGCRDSGSASFSRAGRWRKIAGISNHSPQHPRTPVICEASGSLYVKSVSPAAARHPTNRVNRLRAELCLTKCRGVYCRLQLQ